MAKARITITLPDDLVTEIDRRERNRSKFVLEAVEHELAERRRRELQASLEKPHPLTDEVAELGFGEWGSMAADGDDELLDPTAGTAVRWLPGEGWVEDDS